MARSSQQKNKLLLIAKYLLEASDEEHPLSMAQILAYLRQRGVEAERKSVYDDIEALRQFGLDIDNRKGPNGGYFISQRRFELAELKLLVDAVQASRFITKRKTDQLIRKLSSLASCYQAAQLQRQLYGTNRVKAMNESIYYNVDALHQTINSGHQAEFRYFDYTVSKQRRFRRDGELYRVSPYALIWDNQHYYLLAWDARAGALKHYRVDRMVEISETDLTREGGDAFARIDMSRYTQQTFDMFGGRTELVTLEFDEKMAGLVIDRFGKDTMIIGSGEGRFTVDVPVAVSSHFYAWVSGLDGACRILGPETVRQGMKEHLRRLSADYAD
ncbi:MAG: WYL domain-containing protein [Firmicutes bacterium]|nr:WYL domain-containing protein [Bacillota bacterium]